MCLWRAAATSIFRLVLRRAAHTVVASMPFRMHLARFTRSAVLSLRSSHILQAFIGVMQSVLPFRFTDHMFSALDASNVSMEALDLPPYGALAGYFMTTPASVDAFVAAIWRSGFHPTLWRFAFGAG